MTARQANFSRFEDCTKEDMEIIEEHLQDYAKALPARVLEHLKLLEGDSGGFAVNRLEHSLQTATRAHRDGRDEEYVVCALLHDIGDTLGCYDHATIGAAILKGRRSRENRFRSAGRSYGQPARAQEPRSARPNRPGDCLHSALRQDR